MYYVSEGVYKRVAFCSRTAIRRLSGDKYETRNAPSKSMLRKQVSTKQGQFEEIAHILEAIQIQPGEQA